MPNTDWHSISMSLTDQAGGQNTSQTEGVILTYNVNMHLWVTFEVMINLLGKIRKQ